MGPKDGIRMSGSPTHGAERGPIGQAWGSGDRWITAHEPGAARRRGATLYVSFRAFRLRKNCVR